MGYKVVEPVYLRHMDIVLVVCEHMGGESAVPEQEDFGPGVLGHKDYTLDALGHRDFVPPALEKKDLVHGDLGH